MAKYLLVHPVGSGIDMEPAVPTLKLLKSKLNADAYWLKSWYSDEQGVMYCLWDAGSKEAISKMVKEVLTATGYPLPVEGPYKIDVAIDSEDFR
ncbi:MAG: nickel-binding protein [Chloroflexota bacterium]